MHYKNRANVYKVIGRGVLVVVVVVHICSYLWGEGVSHVGNASVVALVFGFGMDSCQISVILNHCIKTRFFGGLYELQTFVFANTFSVVTILTDVHTVMWINCRR